MGFYENPSVDEGDGSLAENPPVI